MTLGRTGPNLGDCGLPLSLLRPDPGGRQALLPALAMGKASPDQIQDVTVDVFAAPCNPFACLTQPCLWQQVAFREVFHSRMPVKELTVL
jgi:hypothetical protein